MEAFGIPFRVFNAGMDGLDSFDGGLYRDVLGYHEDIRMLRVAMASIKPHELFLETDALGNSYFICLLPDTYWPDVFLFIGPWRNNETAEPVPVVVSKLNLPAPVAAKVTEYLYGVPLIKDAWALRRLALTLFSCTHSDSVQVRIGRLDHFITRQSDGETYNPQAGELFSLKRYEERYAHENALVQAVTDNDIQEALRHLDGWLNARTGVVNSNLADAQRFQLLTLNTLLRKGVERAGAHPAHIDAVSGEFVYRVGTLERIREVGVLAEEMIRRYAGLVSQFAWPDYSALVRQTINTIDFNLRNPLSLRVLAELAHVSHGYLSARFKQETGKTLTDFINARRLHRAAHLLGATLMPVQQIAAQCGYMDMSYFARQFRRHYGMTAKGYRDAKIAGMIK
ncbi:MAG: AraC family transcriptional regulator [Oscillospiraceae bacterium]|jgi:AraC-like DNA-binding protein|nr:AraC family transcriptional regulator [Oscillospiraceae bacterium]